MKRPFVLLLAALSLLAPACSTRAVVETTASPGYTVEVVNPMPHPMDLWYQDSAGEHSLGQVAAGARARFTIVAPAEDDIHIVGRDTGRTHEIRKSVDLERNQVVEVTLRN